MTIHFENEYDLEKLEDVLHFSYEETAREVIEKVLDQEECPYEASVEITFTSDESIKEINMEQRGIDRATDVLSFPMVDFTKPCDYALLETDEADFYFDPDSGELMLGDIVLSIPRIKEQAQEFGHSKKREFAFLIAHSMLHLLGYDHMTEDDAVLMEEKQNQVLTALGITRDLED